jgi:hypothetical protein
MWPLCRRSLRVSQAHRALIHSNTFRRATAAWLLLPDMAEPYLDIENSFLRDVCPGSVGPLASLDFSRHVFLPFVGIALRS